MSLQDKVTVHKHFGFGIFCDKDVREAVQEFEKLRKSQLALVEETLSEEHFDDDDVKKAHIAELFNMKVWIQKVFGFEEQEGE